MKKIAILLLAFAIPGATCADESVRDGWRWGPEAGGGFSLLSESGAGARSKIGGHFHAAVQLAHYKPKYVYDMSVGGLLDFVRATDATVASLYMTAFRTELGFRWRLRRWQFGPTLGLLAGQDVSFAENADVFPDRQMKFAVLAGLRVMREASFIGSDWRWGAYALTDLNLPDRQAFLFGLSLAWEIPFERAKPAEPAYIPPPPAPVPAAEAPPPPSEPQIVKIVGTSVLLNLDSRVLNFELNLAVLPPEKLEIVKVIGYFLRNNPSYWESVRVQGHADVTGNGVLNLNLSEARAHYVRDQIVGVGNDYDKFTAKGFGSSQPLDRAMTPEAHARNRRVEVVVEGT
jgi:outer membrane protein OmpA-like peptidoglycan-associated protein